MLYLASQSPRRRALLQQIHIEFQQLSVTVPEQPQPDENPTDYVQRLALAKARAGWQSIHNDTAVVLGADTAVVIDDSILGKPQDRQMAAAMLQRLSGRTHNVLTGVAVVSAECELHALSSSAVSMREISPAEIHDYCASGESLDKAGGYAIQGRAAVFIQHLVGSYSGVMGLPLYETAALLVQLAQKNSS